MVAEFLPSSDSALKTFPVKFCFFCDVLRLGNSVHTINQVESRRAHNQLSEYGRLRAISKGSFRTLIPIITLFQETMTRRRPKWSVTFMYSTARSTAALPRTEINASSCRTRTWRNLGNRWKGRPQFDCRTFFYDCDQHIQYLFKGVVAVPEKTACSKAIGRNKCPRKPRARFRDLQFFKVKLAAPQIHFLKISWQCNSSPGDQILMKLSPKWLDCV